MPGPSLPTVGILGGGQLGRMLALAAIRMGIQVRFLIPESAGPVEGIGFTDVGDWNDPYVLAAFAEKCDVITVESEWAPLEHVEALPPPIPPLRPSPRSLSLIRDKGVQKKLLADANLPVPDFACCASIEEAIGAAERFSFPVVLKRFQGSYDGYGNATVRDRRSIELAWEKLADERGLLVESWVPFVRELSVLIARRPGGEQVTYPVAYTEQRDHRCHAVEVPAQISASTEEQARRIGLKAVEAVDGIGVTAVELFEREDGTILVNELAPRPHNTGHYSIEGCHTSQFENHLRGILDWPLGDPSLRAPHAVMVNVLGQESLPGQGCNIQDALDVPGVAVHLYGKKEAHPGRKMGHVTATGTAPGPIRKRAERAASSIRF